MHFYDETKLLFSALRILLVTCPVAWIEVSFLLSRIPFNCSSLGAGLLLGSVYVLWTYVHYRLEIGTPFDCEPGREFLGSDGGRIGTAQWCSVSTESGHGGLFELPEPFCKGF